MRISDNVKRQINDYLRHGGKTNRRQQVARLMSALRWIGQTHPMVQFPEQVGRKHVVAFWRNNRHMAPATAQGYWRVFRLLWQWLGRPDTPPPPRNEQATGPL